VSPFAVTRRKALRALGGATAAAALFPFLRHRRALAAGTKPPPRRLLVVFTSCGTIADAWQPTGTAPAFDFAPGAILEPLAPFKSKLLVLSGVNMASTSVGPGSAHEKGIGHLLTARALLSGTFAGGGGATAGFASGISLDQQVAGTLKTTTRFPSLELGVRVTATEVHGRLAYAGSNQPLPPVDDPFVAYKRLFGEVGLAGPQLQQLLAERRSVLDFVSTDLTAMGQRLGGDDRARLTAHTDAIREIERQLAAGGGAGAACKPPVQGAMLDPRAVASFPAVGKLQMDLITQAFACDLTRVVTFMWSNATSGQSFPWLNIADGHHALSHAGDSDLVAKGKLIAINRWYAEQFAYLLGKLDAIPEGTGTMLDNTAVVWGNELGKGNTHTRNNIPLVIAGGCGGFFRTGRHLTFNGAAHSNLLVSLGQAMGLGIDTFGDPTFCTGPLPGLAA
jgi:hypothetical protein